MEDSNTQSLVESIRNVAIEEASAEPPLEIKPDSVDVEVKHVEVAESRSSELQLEQENDSREMKNSTGGSEEQDVVAGEKNSNKGEDESDDSDSENDLQVIVNDEDIFGPAPEAGEEVEGEQMFVEEHYEDLDWAAAEMHYHHAQFYKYVRPGAGPEDPAQAPGSAPGGFTPGSMSGYGMGLWGYPFAYEFVLPASQTIFDVDLEQFEDKPWVYPGVDISDYFNFDFTEETWKQYCEDFARAREEASTKNNMRDDENQGWGYDEDRGYNESSEPQMNRGRVRNNFSNRGEGVGNDRRGSGEGRRHRRQSDGMSQGRHEDRGEYRRNERNEEMPRRRGFSSPMDQTTPLSGRLSRAPSGLSSPSGRAGMYTPRTRISSPSRMQGSYSNGFRRHSTENSGRSWRTSSRRSDEHYDDEEGSYASSDRSDDSDHRESEDEYTRYRNHRLRRFSSQPLESRLGGRMEISRESGRIEVLREREREPSPPPAPAPEKRTVKLSRHIRDEEFDEKHHQTTPETTPTTSNPRRFGEKLERSSASAQVVSQRRSSELVTERRSSSQAIRRIDQAVRETISSQEVKVTPVERRTSSSSSSVRRFQAPEKKPEPPVEAKQPEKKLQSISERRAQVIAERKRAAEAKLAEKVENSERVVAPEVKVSQVSQVRGLSRERTSSVSSSVMEKRIVRPVLRAPVEKLVVKPVKAPAMKPRGEQASTPKQDNGDLRLKVLERVSARWKFHLRMDDEHAKKKRENLIKPPVAARLQKDEEPLMNDAEEFQPERARVEVKRRVQREATRREYDDVYEEEEEERVEYEEELDEDDEDERWANSRVVVDRKRKRKFDGEEWEYAGDGGAIEEGFVSRRSFSKARRRYRDHDAELGDAWEMEDGECPDGANAVAGDDEYEQEEPVYNRRKQRKFNYGVYKDPDEYEYEEEPRREFFYDGSTSSGHGEEMFYNARKRVGKSYSRESDRWTGTLYDSGEEYDE